MCVCFIILFYFNCLLFFSALASFFTLGEELYRQTSDLGGNHHLSARQAWNRSWVITMAVGSSVKTLQGSFPGSHQSASPHPQSPGSAQSSKAYSYHKSRHMWSKRSLRVEESQLSVLK